MVPVNAQAIAFWLSPWSKAFRSACLWFTLGTQPLQGRARPDKEAPRWLRPLFLQRWVGQAIAARLSAQPRTVAYRCGKESEPRWVDAAWARYEWRILREFNDEMLVWIFGMEVERLLRNAQKHPSMAGQVEWVCAVLGASEHLAQLYHELKRRLGMQQARVIVREKLRCFVAWQ